MAIWNDSFYKGVDEYSDGDVEEEILHYVQNPEEPLETFIGDSYAKGYHLLPVRENILNWYPFQKDQIALEIGAGCGAITGALCNKLKRVVSVDLSKRRSKINYERHKMAQNLTIMVGNLNDMQFEETFDYVILNGVLEYAISFTDSDKPYHLFLSNLSRFLKPEGKFLIAIENRLGLKYFNGAKEDHTGNYFLGLNGYVGNETVRTFSKSELIGVISDIGFKFHKFYYPYPDYKFPNEIFTDETLRENEYGRPIINIEEDRYVLFNENLVNESLIKEGVSDVFANSFLVECSREQFEAKVLYAKLNSERNERFRIGTVIQKVEKHKREVIKFPLNIKAEEHVANIFINMQDKRETNIHPLQCDLQDKEVKFPFLNAKTLDAICCEMIQNNRYSDVIDLLHEFFIKMKKNNNECKLVSDIYTEEFCKCFGNHKLNREFECVFDSNIDLIMDNIYQIDGEYVIIDCEWVYPQWIPVSFIEWRAINELYSKHEGLRQIVERAQFMKEFEIDEEMDQAFQCWSEYFAQEYVGAKQRINLAKPMIPVSLDEIHQEERRKKIAVMSLYIDEGYGFSEENKIYKEVCIKDGKFQVEFDLGKVFDIKSLRFDPIEDEIISCCVDNISDGVMIRGSNATENDDNNCQVFDCIDPQYYLKIVGRVSRLHISGEISVKDESEIKRKIAQKEELIKINGDLKAENRELQIYKRKLDKINDALGVENRKLRINNGDLLAKYGYLLTEYKQIAQISAHKERKFKGLKLFREKMNDLKKKI